MFDISNLRILVLNISNVCECRCKYCPNSITEYKKRTQKYKNYMTIDDIILIKDHLKSIEYSGEISITGFGEPFKNPEFLDICKELSCFDNIKIISSGIKNGKLQKNIMKEVIKIYGYNTLEISLHNKEYYTNKNIYYEIKNLNIKGVKIRNHDTEDPNNILIVNNRAGALSNTNSIRNRSCYYPFYELCIDTDGRYLMCAHNWDRYDSNINIKDINIKEYFCNYMQKYRYKLYKDDKNKDFLPCKMCNTNGKIEGYKEFSDWIKEFID